MNLPALTLYTPVFNGEDHLGRLFASLSPLPADLVEVVIVDDASTDGSLAMAVEFAAGRPGTQIIERPLNGGPGKASRDAMMVARGRWIQRVDADDQVVAEGILAALDMAEAGSVDVVVQPYLQERRDGRLERKSRAPWSGQVRTDAYWVGWLPTLWTNMVSTDFLRQRDILFPTLGPGSDARWLALVFANAPLDRVRFSESVSYIWRHNTASLTRRARGHKDATQWLTGLRIGLMEYDKTMAGLMRGGLVTSRDRSVASLYLRHFIFAEELAANRRRDAWRTWREMVRDAPLQPQAWWFAHRLLLPAWIRRPSLFLRGRKKDGEGIGHPEEGVGGTESHSE